MPASVIRSRSRSASATQIASPRISDGTPVLSSSAITSPARAGSRPEYSSAIGVRLANQAKPATARKVSRNAAPISCFWLLLRSFQYSASFCIPPSRIVLESTEPVMARGRLRFG